jgi:hypothetical protein
MYDIFENYATDEKAEIEGVWRPLGTGRVKVARANNNNYIQLLNKLIGEHGSALDGDSKAAVDLNKQVMVEVFAKTVLLDWEGLSYKGKPISYSHDNSKMLLQHNDFRNKIGMLSNEFEAYKLKAEEDEGNG